MNRKLISVTNWWYARLSTVGLVNLFIERIAKKFNVKKPINTTDTPQNPSYIITSFNVFTFLSFFLDKPFL